MWDKNKVYGYSAEFINQNGMPEDNEICIKSNEEERLTREEIKRMFPNQNICITAVDWKVPGICAHGYQSAIVSYYHCNRGDAMLKMLMGARDIEYVESTYSDEVGREYLWSLEKQ